MRLLLLLNIISEIEKETGRQKITGLTHVCTSVMHNVPRQKRNRQKDHGTCTCLYQLGIIFETDKQTEDRWTCTCVHQCMHNV